MSFFDVFRREDDDLGPPPPPFRVNLDDERPAEGRRWRLWIAVAVIIIVLIVALNVAKSLYANWLWFDSLGYTSVYTKTLTMRLILFFAGASLFLLLLSSNLLLAHRFTRLPPAYAMEMLPDGDTLMLRRAMTVILIATTLFAAVIFGAVAAGNWDTVLLFINQQSFGITDPEFGRDLSFYTFTLPALDFFQSWGLAMVIVVTLATAAIYLLRFSIQQFMAHISWPIKLHISALLIGILGLVAWGYWLDIFKLNLSEHGVVLGATYTDLHARLPALYILMAVVALAALLIGINMFRQELMLPTAGLGLWLMAVIVADTIYPAVVQRFEVDPNELERERPYIERNIQFTRYAFALDRIQEVPFDPADAVSEEEIIANQDTIINIRLWDHRPLLETLNQIQSLRPLYAFHDVDVDRYTIDGQYRQVMLAVRELFPDRLPPQSQTWVNRRLQFTHGYGVTMAAVNEVDAEGQPRLFLKDIPPVGVMEVKRPEIYYGENTGDYVIVSSREEEFDYPSGEENVYARYQGSSGVQLNSFIRRLVYAWEFADFNIVISDQLTDESRILYRRDVQPRVHEVAPFLQLDDDPYIVVADGGLYWIQDAYTVSNHVPYSQRYQGSFNYIRNSVKAVVNAYDGSVDLYIADADDPLVQTWARVFPRLFKPLAAMPPSLRAQIRYPETLFNVQVEMYRTYHMTDPRVFYNKEDVWNIPNEIFLGTQVPMEPYYVIMRLPGEQQPEFLLILPFTPANRDNVNAWLAARSDGDNYGSLLAFHFPKERLVFGPSQVEARINQDARIAEQFTLWSQAGSQVLRGNLLLIPIGKSYLYVEPIYLQAAAGRLPELRRVIIVNGSSIAMEPTLDLSLAAIFGHVPATPPSAAQPPSRGGSAAVGDLREIADLVKEAQDAYDRSQERLRAGDFAGYGEELGRLQEALDRLAELTISEEEQP